MAKIRYHYYDNLHPAIVEDDLKRSLGRHARKCNYFYVGRTNNPEARFSAHQRNLHPADKPWDQMIVVYGSYSLGFVVRTENALIKHVQEQKYTNIRWNEKGPQWDSPQTFAVYLLVDATGQPKRLEEYTAEWPSERLSGHYGAPLKRRLQRLLDQHAEGQRRLYVGLTSDPLRRIGQHQRKTEDSWDKLIVLYETASLNYAAQAEIMLIDYVRENYPHANVGAGLLPADGDTYFYVYFLLDKAL